MDIFLDLVKSKGTLNIKAWNKADIKGTIENNIFLTKTYISVKLYIKLL